MNLWALLYPVLIYSCIQYAVSLFLTGLWIPLATAVICLPLLYMMYSRDSQIQDMTLLQEKMKIKSYALILFLAGITSVFSGLLGQWLREVFPDHGYDSVENTLLSGSVFLRLFTLVLAVPVAEELLFRGIIYRRGRHCFGIFVGAAVSAVIFGIAHGNIVQGINAVCLGLVLAYVYEKYRSIYAPIFFHMINNGLVVIIDLMA